MNDEQIVSLYKGKVRIKFNPASHSYYLVEQDGKPVKPTKRLTGVTTYMGIIDKPALIPWAVGLTVGYVRDHLDEIRQGDLEAKDILERARAESNKQRDIAAEIGKAIHQWIDDHQRGNTPEMPSDPKVLQGVNAFLSFLDEYKVTFLWTERILYSKKHGYVGTADMGLKFGNNGMRGKKFLADTKTTNNIYCETGLQTAAYLEAFEEETKEKYDGRLILRISKETEEEYLERMKKYGPNFKVPPYKLFEPVFLDKAENNVDRDFSAFLNFKAGYEWKKKAEVDLKALRS